jgi:lysophospholipase L1-like esterase
VTPHEPTWVLIALGTNDAKRSTRVSGGRLVPVEETQANLVEIVDLVRSIGAKPVLLTPPPVDELLMRDWRFDEALTWRNEDIALSAQSVREAAAARAVPLVDVHRQLASPEGGWHLPDGLHPNREGQARIARSVITSAPWGA